MNPIIEKIKKLLRMKRGGTADEIATALRLAADLAAKHGIDLGSVNPEEESTSTAIGHEDPIISARIQCECKYAGLICTRFFNVDVFVTTLDGKWSGSRHVWRYALRFVGTEWDRKIAAYVLLFLVGHFRRQWSAARRRRNFRARRHFMWGMYVGLAEKLASRQPVPEAAALVQSNRALARTSYIENNFGKLTQTSVRPDGAGKAARWAGFIAGQETEIRPGVETSAVSRSMLAAPSSLPA